MQTNQFLDLLRRLKLTKASKRGAKAFGLSLPQYQRITGGKAPVPRPVALLAIAYVKYGLPNPLWNPDVDQRVAMFDRMGEFAMSLRRSSDPQRDP